MADVELPNPDELKEIKEKRFGRRIGLTTAVFAVMLAVASLGGNHAMKETLLSQQQASDQWAYYQAKAIREHLYRTQKMMLENELVLSEDLSPNAKKSLETSIANLSSEESRYAYEEENIREEAVRLEKQRDESRSKDLHFEYGEALLQIVIASVSIIPESLPVLVFSILMATVGTVACATAYLNIFTPLLQYASS